MTTWELNWHPGNDWIGLHNDWFPCGDGTVVQHSFVCDGNPHCPNGADELDCDPSCPPPSDICSGLAVCRIGCDCPPCEDQPLAMGIVPEPVPEGRRRVFPAGAFSHSDGYYADTHYVLPAGCTLTGGHHVPHGYSGKDTGSNSCNNCGCQNGDLTCTQMACGPTTCTLTGGDVVTDGWTGKDTGSNHCNTCHCNNGQLGCTLMACYPTSSPTSCTLTGGEIVQDGFHGLDTGSNSCNVCNCYTGQLSCTEMACATSPPVAAPATCTLTGGEIVQDGWSGKDSGSNSCNSCSCDNGALTCTDMYCEIRATCKLTGGEVVAHGWSGKDTGSNRCNTCNCIDGALGCTRMACPAQSVWFKCADGHYWVLAEYNCDGYFDCPDGSDERHCPHMGQGHGRRRAEDGSTSQRIAPFLTPAGEFNIRQNMADQTPVAAPLKVAPELSGAEAPKAETPGTGGSGLSTEEIWGIVLASVVGCVFLIGLCAMGHRIVTGRKSAVPNKADEGYAKTFTEDADVDGDDAERDDEHVELKVFTPNPKRGDQYPDIKMPPKTENDVFSDVTPRHNAEGSGRLAV